MGRHVAAIALLLGLTAPGQAEAYEIKWTEAGASVHWGEEAVALRLDPSAEGLVAPGEAAEALEMATEAWRLPEAPTVLANRGRPGPLGYDPSARRQYHGVYALSEWPYGDGQLAVTVSTFEERTGRLLDADIVVNGNHRFDLVPERGGDRGTRGRGGRYDLGAVLTHEVGHTLGLAESPDHEDATMWSRIGRGETHQRTIELDDEEGVLAIYAGHNAEPAAGCGGAAVAGRPLLGTVLPWALGLLLGLTCLVLRRRRSAPKVRHRALPSVALPATLVASALLFPVPPIHSTLRGADERSETRASAGEVGPWPAVHVPSAVPRPTGASRPTNGDPVVGAALVRAALVRTALVGTAHRLDTRLRDGVLWTRVRVSSGAEAVVLEVPGGSLGGISQRVGDAPLPPEGAVLVVEEGPTGMLAWTPLGRTRRGVPSPFGAPAADLPLP